MALTQQLALVPDGVTISTSQLTKVTSALSKQVVRDFGPIWNVQASVDSFARLEDVPADYWPIIVGSDVQDAAGFHDDDHGQPFAVVEFGADWSLSASHECLEMLADPFGRRLRAGDTLDQAVKLGLPQRRVRYLVEVCDPAEDAKFAYQVNGVMVSDFYTPDFFDPVGVPSVRYSFTGAIKSPRTVLSNGYISWLDPITNHWMQLRMFRDELSSKIPHVVDLSTQTTLPALLMEGMSLRAAIDRVTMTAQRVQRSSRPVARDMTRAARQVDESSASCARMWRTQISRLRSAAQNGATPAKRTRKRRR
jgi:hypothetical protein